MQGTLFIQAAIAVFAICSGSCRFTELGNTLLIDDPRYRDPTDLYRYFDQDDVLLYVGISNCQWQRDRAHQQRAGWYKHAWHLSIETFPTRCLAEWAERAAIHDENPCFNTKREPPYEFIRVHDKWYLKQTKGEPIGENRKWFRIGWPESSRAVTWLSHVPCDPPHALKKGRIAWAPDQEFNAVDEAARRAQIDDAMRTRRMMAITGGRPLPPPPQEQTHD